MKKFKKFFISIVIVAALFAAGAVSFYAFYMYPRYSVPVLMYHRINETENDTLSVSPRIFARQMAFLHKAKYDVISLDELVEGMKSGKKFSHKTVAITFDDGYVNNFLYAFPLLAKYKFPAAIFIITDKIGQSDEFINWDQARVMMNNGITFGSHTMGHAYLPDTADGKKLWKEIAGSKEVIEKELGKKADFLCYPVGGFTPEIEAMVKKAGYKAAFTTNRGLDPGNKDLFAIRRIKVMNKPFHFRIQLSGYYDLFRALKKGS